MSEYPAPKASLGNLIQVLVPLGLIAVLVAMCIQLLLPFVGLLLWTIILAICFQPVHRRLKARGMSDKLAAIVIGVALTALVLVPAAIAAFSAARNIPEVVASLQSGERHIRPPPEALQNVPVVGAKVHAAWSQASEDMPGFMQEFGPQLASFTKVLVSQAGGLFAAVLGLVLAVIFAAIALAYWDMARDFVAQIFARITGERHRGEHYMTLIGATVRSVANGVIGVAFVQALLCGIGFFWLGIPGAGVLSLLAMVLGVLQVPVVLVTLPAIIYAFSTQSTTAAIVFTVWFVLAGLSDVVLKPMLIGHGLEVPMPVILLGVIGGVIAYGLVGLFVGAVVLSVGWVLWKEWLETGPAEATSAAPAGAAS